MDLIQEASILSNPDGATHVSDADIQKSQRLLSEGLALSQTVSDEFLDAAHPELRVMFRTKLIAGEQLIHDGVAASDRGDNNEALDKQQRGLALQLDWINWWNANWNEIRVF